MTCSSSAAGRPARRRPTGWPRPATTWWSSRRSGSRARRPAATASRRGRSSSSPTWAWPGGSTATTATTACGRSPTASPSSSQWPEHPDYPSHGFVVRRRDLDEMVADRAVKAGARIEQGTEAIRPVLHDGLVRGAVVEDKESGATPGDLGPLRRRGRRVALAVRPGARHRPQPHLPAGHGDPGLLREPDARRPVDRERARRPGPRRGTRCPATAGSSRSATGP